MTDIPNKPIKAKPQLYAMIFHELKVIAEHNGYNLLIHGSMDRDMDLIVVPWSPDPSDHLDVLNEFSEYLGCGTYKDLAYYHKGVRFGGRNTYIINLWRGGKINDYYDVQYYLDISFTPFVEIEKEY